MKFQVGDRVRLTVDGPDGNSSLRAGDEGTVRYLNGSMFLRPIGVQFDREIDGHDLYEADSGCPDGYGWYVFESEIEPVDSEPMQIPTAEELLALLSCR